MQQSHSNPGAPARWPCAAALALMLLAPSAFAHDDNERREETTKEDWFTFMRNPCVKNPATNGQGERIEEFIQCDNPTGACGTLRTETRTTQKGDKSEQRVRTRGEGFGRGDVTLARYDIRLDNTTVTRTKRNDTRTTIFNREMGHPEKTTLPFGSTSGTCSPANVAACASPFVVTTKSETRNGTPVRPEAEPDMECKNRDGSKRQEHED